MQHHPTFPCIHKFWVIAWSMVLYVLPVCPIAISTLDDIRQVLSSGIVVMCDYWPTFCRVSRVLDEHMVSKHALYSQVA